VGAGAAFTGSGPAGTKPPGFNQAGTNEAGIRPPIRVSSGNPARGPRFPTTNAASTAQAAAVGAGSVEHSEQAAPPEESFFDQDLLG
jgi:hypothetical protein